MISGPDVSLWQGPIDWGAVARSGRSFAIAKASQGLRTDPMFAANWQGIRTAGLIRGAYHFSDNGNATAEAQHFADMVLGNGYQPGDGLFLDLETGSGDLSGWAREFLAVLTGRTGDAFPGEYSSQSFWLQHNLARANPTSRWIAAYGPQPPFIQNDLWQHTDKARIPGIATLVDESIFQGTTDQLLTLFGGGVTPAGGFTPDPGGVVPVGPNGQPTPAGPPLSHAEGNQMLASRPSGGFDLVVRGLDNAIWHTHDDTIDQLGTRNWENLGGTTFEQPSCVWDQTSQEFAVVCIGDNNSLFSKRFRAASGWDANWTELAGQSPSPKS